MTEIIHFPTKNTDIPYKYTPKGALEYVLENINAGNANPTSMIIVWTEEEQDSTSHRFMVGGGESLTEVVGLLEITKHTLLS